jgi:hypothetical protein
MTSLGDTWTDLPAEDVTEELKQLLASFSEKETVFSSMAAPSVGRHVPETDDSLNQLTEAERSLPIEEAVARSIQAGTTALDWQRIKQHHLDLEESIRRTIRRHQDVLLTPLTELQQRMNDIAARMALLSESLSQDFPDEAGKGAQWRQIEEERHRLRHLFQVELLLGQSLFFVQAFRRFERDHAGKLNQMHNSREHSAKERQVLMQEADTIEQAAIALSDLLLLEQTAQLERWPWLLTYRTQTKAYQKQIEELDRDLLDQAVSQRLMGATRALLRGLEATQALCGYLDTVMAESLTKADELGLLLDPPGSHHGAALERRTTDSKERDHSMQMTVSSKPRAESAHPSLSELEEMALENMLLLVKQLFAADGFDSFPLTDPTIERHCSGYRRRLQKFHEELFAYLERVTFIEEALAEARLGMAFRQRIWISGQEHGASLAMAEQNRPSALESFLLELADRIRGVCERASMTAKLDEEPLSSTSRLYLMTVAFYPQLGWTLRSAAKRWTEGEWIRNQRPSTPAESQASPLHDCLDVFVKSLDSPFVALAGRAWIRRLESAYRYPVKSSDTVGDASSVTTIEAKYRDGPQLQKCFQLAWTVRDSLPAFATVVSEVATAMVAIGESACGETDRSEPEMRPSLLSSLLSLDYCCWSLWETVHEETMLPRCLEELSAPRESPERSVRSKGTLRWQTLLDQLEKCGNSLTRKLLHTVAHILALHLFCDRIGEDQHCKPQDALLLHKWATADQAREALCRLGAFLDSRLHRSSPWTRYLQSELVQRLERTLVCSVVLRPLNTDTDLARFLKEVLPIWRAAIETIIDWDLSRQDSPRWNMPMFRQLERLIELELEGADPLSELKYDALPLHLTALFYISRSGGRIRQPHLRLQWPMQMYQAWLECHAHDEPSIWQSIEPSIQLYSRQVHQSTEKIFIPQFRVLQRLRQRLDMLQKSDIQADVTPRV